MTPMAAALTGALISGIGMYAIGTRAAQDNEPGPRPALVQTLDGQYAYAPAGSLQPLVHGVSPAPVQSAMFTPAAAPQVVKTAATPRVQRVAQREPVTSQPANREAARPGRSWKTRALVIGGSAGTGAGVGAVVGGKKGALIGAAIGGGAASIYEATRR